MVVVPRCPEVHFNRGLAYRKKGQLENAVMDYTQAIELDPRFTAAYGNRGFAFFKLGMLPAAKADFRKVLELDPKDATAQKNLELILKMQEGEAK